METTTRFHLLMDNEDNRVMIFDAVTGRIQHPACWQDISAYYYYLVGRNRLVEAQCLLAESMSGSKPITSMINRAGHAGAEQAVVHSMEAAHG
jgi:hypothetical protein